MPSSKKSAQVSSSTGPLILIAIGIVLILIVLILMLFNAENNGGQAANALPTATLASDIPYPEISRISLEDARAAFDNKSAIFLDVRSADSYQQQHIPGSLSVPLDQLETQIPSQLDPNAVIIPYCT